MSGKRFTSCYLVIICLISVSCRSEPDDQPELGSVKGIVTLDGSPLEGALVQFTPEKGRGSQGITNTEGVYELNYLSDTKGARLGKHRVTIKTLQEDDSDPDAAKIKEIIPAKYNTETTLTAEVKAGDNQHHFALTSE